MAIKFFAVFIILFLASNPVFSQTKQIGFNEVFSVNADLSSSPCRKALAQGAVCEAANKFAVDLMKADGLEAMTIVQDVQTGALVAYAASEPSKLDVTTPLLPLSVSKVFLVASWWDSHLPDTNFENIPIRNSSNRKMVGIPEIIFNGSDSAARQMAIALRQKVGTEKVLKDFERYGFGQKNELTVDQKFWAKIPASWRKRLTPPSAYFSANAQTSEIDWADTLSLGETNYRVTGLHLSRFMQAVGNDGVLISPFAFEEQADAEKNKKQLLRQLKNASRIMEQSTAARLQSALLETVRQGTATGINSVLAETGWQIGGKTGTMTDPTLSNRVDLADGWFAGLIFSPQGKSRFTVATFVRHGGFGGGNAAKISAKLVKFIIERSKI